MCVVCLVLCALKGGCSGCGEKCSAYSVCVCVNMSDMCVFVLAPQHANGAVFACRVSVMRVCVSGRRASAECEWSCELTHDHISHISASCMAALTADHTHTDREKGLLSIQQDGSNLPTV